MCGIAGLIHRDGATNIGKEMTAMLKTLKHRGPDSTGFAIYGTPRPTNMSCASRSPSRRTWARSIDIHEEIRRRRAEVEKRLAELGVETIEAAEATPYAFRYRIRYDGDMKKLAD